MRTELVKHLSENAHNVFTKTLTDLEKINNIIQKELSLNKEQIVKIENENEVYIKHLNQNNKTVDKIKSFLNDK